MIKKIKVDYPGFAEKTKGRGFDNFVAKTISENKQDTFKMMAKIVDFFRDRHLDLFKLNDTIDTLQCKKNLELVKRHNFSINREMFEGFWLNEYGSCVIAIVKVANKPLQYKGYVVESRKGSRLLPGMIFYDFEQLSSKTFFTKSVAGESNLTFYVHSIFRNDSTFTAGPYHKWYKLRTYKAPLLASIPKNPTYTTGKWLDSNNYLIKIPSSSVRNGIIVDSLINANPQIRKRLQNLIIDIRDNTGGSVAAYDPLLPLIYTNPILLVNGSLYCTEDEIQRTKDNLNEYLKGDDVDSVYVNKYRDWIKRKEDNLGGFITSA